MKIYKFRAWNKKEKRMYQKGLDRLEKLPNPTIKGEPNKIIKVEIKEIKE